MKTKAHTFKTFPEFSELKLSDRDVYNKLIAKYPPISEISFSSLMTWWSALDNCKISVLNDNIVIPYWLPGDEKNSGLSLIGTNKIDESVCEIFDYQKSTGKECKLVHVPAFVLSKVQFPDMYNYAQEGDYDEILLPVNISSDFSKAPDFIRAKIASFQKATKGKIVTLKPIDLGQEHNQDQVINNYEQWKNKKHSVVINKLTKHAENTFIYVVKNVEALGQEVLCTFIDDEMHSFTIIESPSNPDYKILKYSGFSCEIPGLYEYVRYRMASQFNLSGVRYVNMAIHIGDPNLTAQKLTLNPTNNFRKFTVTPISSKQKTNKFVKTNKNLA